MEVTRGLGAGVTRKCGARESPSLFHPPVRTISYSDRSSSVGKIEPKSFGCFCVTGPNRSVLILCLSRSSSRILSIVRAAHFRRIESRKHCGERPRVRSSFLGLFFICDHEVMSFQKWPRTPFSEVYQFTAAARRPARGVTEPRCRIKREATKRIVFAENNGLA